MGRKKRFRVVKFMLSMALIVPVVFGGNMIYGKLEEEGVLDKLPYATTKTVDSNGESTDVVGMYNEAKQQLEQIKRDIASGDIVTREEVNGLLDDLGEEVDTSELRDFLDKLLDYLNIES